MLNVGETLEIEGREVLVCFTETYNDTNYFCSSYDENDKVVFNIYKYKFDNDKLMVAEVTDEEELKPVVGLITSEAIDQYGLPEDFSAELEKFLNNA